MLQTERLLLRPISPADNQSVFNYRSDSETNQYQGFVPETIEEVDEFIAKNPTEFNQPSSWFQLVIVLQATNEVIGDVGVHFLEDNQQCELGITLAKQHHGRGYALEALNAVINQLFNSLNKHRIFASLDPANIGSIKLMENLGFRKEAHFKQSLFINGEWVDDVIFALLKPEWNK